MEITEEKLYEAFNLQPPEKTGAGGKGQEVAEPAGGETVETQERDDVMDQDAAGEGKETAGPEGGESQEGQEPESGKQPLTQQQRRENAARRRQQERQEAIDRAVNEARQAAENQRAEEMKGFFEKLGLVNTVSGEPITSMEEAIAWKQQMDANKLSRDLKDGKLTVEQINQVIGNHPAVRKAQEVIRQEDTLRQQEQERRDQERITGELEQISSLSAQLGGGPVRSVGDLLQMPRSTQFRQYVAKGYSFLDAYKLAHMEELANARASAAQRQAVNKLRGKDHLRSAGNPQGGGAISVPAAEMRLYRAMNPGATDAQIQAHYNKYKGEQ